MKQMVCHYTSIESFQEMIENISHDGGNHFLTFWATSIYAMNDPSEFLHGYKLLKEKVLPKIEKEIDIIDKDSRLSRIWERIVGKTVSTEGKDYLINHIFDNHETPFIISFSKMEDFLPMWNAYSDRGRGVCLCFNNMEYVFRDGQPDIQHKLHTMDITYKEIDEDIQDVIKKLYKEYYQNYKGIRDRNQREKMMIDYLVALIVVFSAYHKHEAYQYEQESRLVEFRHDEKDVHYRIGNNGQLKPYIEVKVNLKYLEKVIIGPCADSESVIRELKNQLRRYGIKEITSSNVPYRDI